MVFSYCNVNTNPFDHWGCHVSSFPTGVLLFKWIRSFSTSARSTLSFLTGVCFIHPKLSLFSRPLTLFLQGLRFLNRVSILLMGRLSILFRQCSYPVILRKILALSSSFFVIFLLRWIQVKFSVLIIFPSLFQVFSYAGVPLNHSPLSILIRSAEDIFEDSCFHSQFVQLYSSQLTISSFSCI